MRTLYVHSSIIKSGAAEIKREKRNEERNGRIVSLVGDEHAAIFCYHYMKAGGFQPAVGGGGTVGIPLILRELLKEGSISRRNYRDTLPELWGSDSIVELFGPSKRNCNKCHGFLLIKKLTQ